MNNTITSKIEINAPISRVWKALTDHREFGEWFCVKIEAPFEVGKPAVGQMRYPGYEHLRWEVQVKEIKAPELFSFTWHPYAVDPDKDYSQEEPTLVEFRLRESERGTLLVVTESGFEKIPEDRRSEAFRMNTGGWEEQVKNIEQYVSKAPT